MNRAAPAFALLLAACSVPDPGPTRLIGHGGLGEGAGLPMNSAQALQAALALGLDGVELDAQLTADSVLVAYHAPDLDQLTACSGPVNARRWDELRACAAIHGGRSYPIARLDSLLPALARAHPRADFTLDCKLRARGDWWAYLHAFTDALLRLDDDPALHGRLLAECRTEDFLRLLLLKRPGFTAFYYAEGPDGAAEAARRLGCAGITMALDRSDAQTVERFHAAGLQVALFGASGRMGHRRALRQQPDRLQTDDPALAAGLRQPGAR